jgi:hypothetical protein
MRERRLARVVPVLASWLDTFNGTQAAPWIWWGLALVVMIALLLGGLKLLGLFPE